MLSVNHLVSTVFTSKRTEHARYFRRYDDCAVAFRGNFSQCLKVAKLQRHRILSHDLSSFCKTRSKRIKLLSNYESFVKGNCCLCFLLRGCCFEFCFSSDDFGVSFTFSFCGCCHNSGRKNTIKQCVQTNKRLVNRQKKTFSFQEEFECLSIPPQ